MVQTLPTFSIDNLQRFFAIQVHKTGMVSNPEKNGEHSHSTFDSIMLYILLYIYWDGPPPSDSNLNVRFTTRLPY